MVTTMRQHPALYTQPWVYISGSLTCMTEEARVERRALYESLAEVCQLWGLAAYLPHKVSDPKLAASLTPEQVDTLDREAVMRSILVLACVDEPSTGVGIEVEMACHANVPVWLVTSDEALRQGKISRLVRGSPATREESLICYLNIEDAKEQLYRELNGFIRSLNDPSRPELLRLHPLP